MPRAVGCERSRAPWADRAGGRSGPWPLNQRIDGPSRAANSLRRRRRAQSLDGALGALGLAGHADPAAVVDQEVRQLDPRLLREERHQVALDLLGGLSIAPA